MREPGAIAAAVLALLALWWLGRLAFVALLRLAADPPGPARRFSGWARFHPIRAQAKQRFPRLYAVVAARLEPRRFLGLPLTLLVVGAAYAAGLFGELLLELRQADEVLRFDRSVSAIFDGWRDGILTRLMLWVTAFGDTPTLVAVSLAATGLLWGHRRQDVLLPLWIAIVGAQATTWIGKYVIERQRPEFLTPATAFSPSFPSGHATGAMAVYGFLAYVVARDIGSPARRYDIAYWTLVLVALIGFSRIFLTVHYASDVAGGFLVGGFWLLVGFTLAEWRRGGPKPAAGGE